VLDVKAEVLAVCIKISQPENHRWFPNGTRSSLKKCTQNQLHFEN